MYGLCSCPELLLALREANYQTSQIIPEPPGGSCWPSLRDWRFWWRSTPLLGGSRLSQGSSSSSTKTSALNPRRLFITLTAEQEQETVNTRGSILGRESPSAAAELLRWLRKS